MSFIRNYIDYCSITESPEIYNYWSALSTLSALASRRVWIDQGHFTIYPNMYIVLVGLPGGRKTTAMEIAKNILLRVGDIPLAATCMTKESVCLDMMANIKQFQPPGSNIIKQYSPYMLCLTELSHFLAINPAHMIDFLTAIYDQEFYDTKTKNKGDDVIPAPYLSMLACTTPNNILRYLREDVISGGFSRRALFIWSHKDGEPKAFPQITPEANAAMSKVLEYAAQLNKVKGQFVWDEEAKQFYKDWYDSLFYSLIKHTDPTTLGYFKCKHVHLLKIAMLISLSESLSLKLELPHLKLGLELLKQVEDGIQKVFAGLGRNELNAVGAKIISLLDMANTPLPDKYIKKIMFGEANATELTEVLNHLVASDSLYAFDERDPQSNAVLCRWYAKPDMAKEWLAKPTELRLLAAKLRGSGI